MRVTFIDQTGGDIGGAQLSLALLIEHLPMDIEPSLIFFNDGAFADRMRKRGLTVDIMPLQDRSSASTREHPKLSAVLEFPRTIVALARLLRQRQAEAVHTNSVKAHVFGDPAARLAGVPCVAHLRDVIEGSGLRAIRTILRTCTQERIAISEVVRRSVNVRNTRIIKNPLDLSLYRAPIAKGQARAALGIPDDEIPLVVFIGRVNRWKRQDMFLRAIAAVAGKTSIRALLVGSPIFRDADYLPELRRLSTSLGLDSIVTFRDWIDDPRIMYAAADVHVNCSIQEPFGRTVIESAAMGVPSVCFDDAGVAEWMINEETGIAVPAGDEQRLAAAIERLVINREFRMDASMRSASWAQQFDANVHAQSVAEVLRGLPNHRS